MKVRITEKGVNDTNGNIVAIGTVMEVQGDVIPAWLVNKCVAHEMTGGEIITGQAGAGRAMSAAAKERADLVQSAQLLGISVTDAMTVEEIKAAIDNMGQA